MKNAHLKVLEDEAIYIMRGGRSAVLNDPHCYFQEVKTPL